jgi:uncharacterized membrane protein YgdD (TMEM256/DUF423 family)
MMMRICGGLAGVYGASGVVLLALGAHHPAGASLTNAGQMLLFHVPVLLVLAFQPLAGRLTTFAALILVLGAGLFAADIALRHLTPLRLFPMAAPIGGSLAIGGWLLLGLGMVLRKST